MVIQCVRKEIKKDGHRSGLHESICLRGEQTNLAIGRFNIGILSCDYDGETQLPLKESINYRIHKRLSSAR